MTMRLRDILLGQLARDDFLDLILQTQRDMRDIFGRDGGVYQPLRVDGEERLDFIVQVMAVAVVPLEQSGRIILDLYFFSGWYGDFNGYTHLPH